MQTHKKFTLNLVMQLRATIVMKLRAFYHVGLVFGFTHYDSHISQLICYRMFSHTSTSSLPGLYLYD